MFESKLEDADADDDGLINFDEFLASYGKPKPVLKNILIMVVNTAVIWGVLQSPLDTMIKLVAVAVLLLKPQLIARPVVLVYDSLVALVDQYKAQAELASRQQQARWRPT